MKRLRVLITNNTLSYRAGTELYARDLAFKLLEKGHSPILYSTRLGAVAEELRRKTIPVVDDLSMIGEPPDIIHGHHHLDTMNALLHFPQTPALYVCHGWLPWEEMPPHFPRIYKYIAVDDLCEERLITESAIPRTKTEVLYNFADTERFKARTPLPLKPKRALIFSNYLREQTTDVLSACGKAGIVVDIAGELAGTSVIKPEEILPQYDIVFAKAKAAIEALCVGCVVIVYDRAGTAGMVTTQNYEELRSLNFGVRTLQKPHDEDFIYNEILRYNTADADIVSQQIRKEASINTVMDRLLVLYDEVLLKHAESPVANLAEEQLAVARYMGKLRVHLSDFTQNTSEHIKFLDEINRSQSTKINMYTNRIEELENRIDAIQHSKTIKLRNAVVNNPFIKLIKGTF